MKKLSILGLVLSIISVGCLKDTPNVDLTKVGTVVELPYSGLGYFSQDALDLSSGDVTIDFVVNIASPYPLNKDLSVTVGVSDAARTAYNATSAVQYELMPDSCYSFPTTSAVIAAGSRQASFSVTFYKDKIDPTQNYLLPISITDASGETISGNFGTHYFHAIGNPLAGSYLQNFYRWNDIDTTNPPNSTVFEDEPATVSPTDPTTVVLPESYITTFVGPTAGIALTFSNDAGELGDFSVGFDDNTTEGLAAGGFTIAQAPVLVSYQIVGDASTHYAGSTFRTYTVLINSSGGKRSLIDVFTKQ